MDTVTASAALLLICMILLGFTCVHPIVAMSIFNVALTFGPLLNPAGKPDRLCRHGSGPVKAASNIGTTILDITVGVIQDRTPRGTYIRPGDDLPGGHFRGGRADRRGYLGCQSVGVWRDS
ncbi:hypothetical protein BC938DRAFT_473493 [Jimgerdemannia flammicorona]|uniref:Uncharacterized protein n=1 Tax=Jimgerdemannia flammicorona TaxID=994334 RepID=A0A433QT94_9FUNG|nr:hypothetical protein BC938DRAFT_473493 [Jimgerdemannia flammicorona]